MYDINIYKMFLSSCVRLSGLSPFAGDDDLETLRNIKYCDWEFDDEAFEDISSEGLDFIRRLLVKEPNRRMTVHDCLEHPWLKGDLTHLTTTLAKHRYVQFSERIKMRYSAWGIPKVPIGKISNFSSLCKLRPQEFKIFEGSFDRREAAPRFIMKPHSTITLVGQSARFECRIIAASPPIVNWYRGGTELKQSLKHMKRYWGSDYALIINRCSTDDRGEYIVTAVNSFGTKSEVMYLNVEKLPEHHLQVPRAASPLRMPHAIQRLKVYQFGDELAPKFTFHLRPRFIQEGIGVKLIATVSGSPRPKVQWFKDNLPLADDPGKYCLEYSYGIVSIELYLTSPSDSGLYSCVATNMHGMDSTYCSVVVEAAKVGQTTAELPYSRLTIATAAEVEEAKKMSPPLSPTKRGRKPKFPLERRQSKMQMLTAPYFKEKLYDVDVADGDSALLMCQVRGVPDPDVEWFKDGQLLDTSSGQFNIQYVPSQGECTLGIVEVYPDDEGEYSCKAWNTEGEAITACFLSVVPPRTSPTQPAPSSPQPGSASPIFMRKAPFRPLSTGNEQAPVFISHLQSKHVLKGERVIIEAVIMGEPQPDVIWIFNNKEMHTSAFCKMEVDGFTYRLIIYEAFPEDSGIYACEATNEVGTTSSTCSLLVASEEHTDDPLFLEFPQSASIEESGAVRFSCELEETDCEVKWTQAGKSLADERTSTNYNYKFTQINNRFSFEIQGVTPQDAGLYYCTAKTRRGMTQVAFSLNLFEEI